MRTALREVTWTAAAERKQDWRIGTYIAKPLAEGGDLVVTISNLTMELHQQTRMM
jgi:hypothetical protein